MLLWLRRAELEPSKPKADTEFWVVYHYIIIIYQENGSEHSFQEPEKAIL